MIVNLETHGHLYNDFLMLVEKSYGYVGDFSFAEDFAPMLSRDNFKNCWMIYENEEVKATIAFKKKVIKLHSEHPIIFIGGIAVKETQRGKGYFNRLFNGTIAHYENVAWLGLWSEKKELFDKYGFSPAFNQYFIKQAVSSSLSNPFDILSGELSSFDLDSWKKLYSFSVMRSADDWNEVQKILKKEIYVLKNANGDWIFYAIKNKGFDLQNVFYEWGGISMEIIRNNLKVCEGLGDIWGDFSLNDIKIFSEYSQGANLSLKIGNSSIYKKWELEWAEWSKKNCFLISGLDSI